MFFLQKGFCRAKFLGEVCALEGAVRGEVLGEVFGAKFLENFSGLSCWDIHSKKSSGKTSSQNSHGSVQQKFRNTLVTPAPHMQGKNMNKDRDKI